MRWSFVGLVLCPAMMLRALCGEYQFQGWWWVPGERVTWLRLRAMADAGGRQKNPRWARGKQRVFCAGYAPQFPSICRYIVGGWLKYLLIFPRGSRRPRVTSRRWRQRFGGEEQGKGGEWVIGVGMGKRPGSSASLHPRPPPNQVGIWILEAGFYHPNLCCPTWRGNLKQEYSIHRQVDHREQSRAPTRSDRPRGLGIGSGGYQGLVKPKALS
ncbi:hypothetical protein B0H16DRAFT_1836116 [Mycena metata]|uniref:Secreted protein n=1 Tax=Mycena metata TaxID=1033252 RepID=A0AAD7NBN3_9AGAR|nr:hypothetical protein B0H16DRAFT_1836116 [Mycena metata]